MNKKLVKRALTMALAAVICTIPLTFTNSASAAVSVQDLSHQINIQTNKTWTIKLSKSLHQEIINKLYNYVVVTTPNGEPVSVGLSYNYSNKAIVIAPPIGGYKTSCTYTIIVKEGLYDSERKSIEKPTVKEFSTISSAQSTSFTTYQLNFTLDQFVDKQVTKAPSFVRSYGYNTKAERTDIKQYMDPDRFKNDSYGIYQFMNLNYVNGITANELNSSLTSEGVLSGKGEAFLKSAEVAKINPAYLVAHAILETGHGTSQLAKGVTYNGRTVYNFFGIGAYDSDPVGAGSKRAYEEGWFTPEEAIAGGASWIAQQYINTSSQQNTLYEMRWNVHGFNDPWHQYSTDVPWAYKQIKYIKQILDKCPNAELKFEIPVYKK